MVRETGSRSLVEYAGLDYRRWVLKRSSEIRILRSEARNQEFTARAGDSVRMHTDDYSLQDMAGNAPWLANPYLFIDGEARAQVVVPVLGNPDAAEGLSDTTFRLTLMTGDADLKGWFEGQGTLGVGYGPIKVATDETVQAKMKFRWSIGVFDGMGQFVAQQSGLLDCTSPELSSRCRSEEGVSVGFEWNYRDQYGRRVGSGVYLLKFQLNSFEETSRLGVMRGTE
jgi:hypothetical protein